MLENRRRTLTQLFMGAVALLSLLLVAPSAFGAGRVEWKTKTIKERDTKSWRIEISIYLPKPPDTAYVPMKFEFQPTAYYERAMVDGDKLVERTVPLEHQQSLIESVDVGFLDTGTAKIQSRTKFTFKVTRAHDYNAGEYKVTIYDVRNNQKIGTPTRIKLTGENEIIDRRAITFSGKKKEKKKEDEEAKEEKKKEDGDTDGDGWDDSEQSEQVDLQEMDDGELEEGEVKEKPGACGCRVPGAPSPSHAGLLALMCGGVLLRRRRRQS